LAVYSELEVIGAEVPEDEPTALPCRGIVFARSHGVGVIVIEAF
jgi:hypothetical protein